MARTQFRLANSHARLLWLQAQLLLQAPFSAKDHSKISDTVARLGMVQLDSIGVLARAHDHILWSRHDSYRKTDFHKLLTTERCVFEHFSHDAAILPLACYPYWKGQLRRKSERYRVSTLGKAGQSAKTQAWILKEIDKNGPMCSQDFTRQRPERANRKLHAWMRPPCKNALDYLWLAGKLSVSHRKGFTKFYDLTHRVIPAKTLAQSISSQEQIDWLCSTALHRLVFATARQIQRFYDGCSLQEVLQWLKDHADCLQEIAVEDSSGNYSSAYAFLDLEAKRDCLPSPSKRIRIVNPFDPVVRDRSRLQQLFGFHYRIEIYVPANKRLFGYYVCPLLEGGRFIGRIDVRADRQTDSLQTRAWWLEKGVDATPTRVSRVGSELRRLARLADVSVVGDLPRVSVAAV